VNNLLTHGAGGGGGESDLNVCSVLFEYITITPTAPHTPAGLLLFYYTRARRMPPPEKSVQMIVALATYDSAPSSKWRAIVVIIYYMHYNDIIVYVYRVSVANRVLTHTRTGMSVGVVQMQIRRKRHSGLRGG